MSHMLLKKKMYRMFSYNIIQSIDSRFLAMKCWAVCLYLGIRFSSPWLEICHSSVADQVSIFVKVL